MKIKKFVMAAVSLLLGLLIVVTYLVDYAQSKNPVSENRYAERSERYIHENEPKDSDASETININTATAEELSQFLPYIGKTKAESIVRYRDSVGGFRSVEELIEVNGIGESTLDLIRKYCRISDD